MRFSKLLLFIVKCNKCGRHSHMLQFHGKNIFSTTFYHKSRKDWTNDRLSLCIEYDAYVCSERYQPKEKTYYETCRGRFRSDMARLQESGYIKLVNTKRMDKSIVIKTYEILKMPTPEQLDQCKLPEPINYNTEIGTERNGGENEYSIAHSSNKQNTREEQSFQLIVPEFTKHISNEISVAPAENKSLFVSETVCSGNFRMPSASSSLHIIMPGDNNGSELLFQTVSDTKIKQNTNVSKQYQNLHGKPNCNTETHPLENTGNDSRKRKLSIDSVICKFSRRNDDANRGGIIIDLSSISETPKTLQIKATKNNYYETFTNLEKNTDIERRIEIHENNWSPVKIFSNEQYPNKISQSLRTATEQNIFALFPMSASHIRNGLGNNRLYKDSDSEDAIVPHISTSTASQRKEDMRDTNFSIPCLSKNLNTVFNSTTVSESEGSNISNNCNKGYPMTVSESEWSNISSSYNKGYLMTVSESEGSNISSSYNKGYPMTVSESEWSNISSSYNKGYLMTVSESEGSNISNSYNKGHPMTVSESEWSNISNNFNKGYLMTVSESEGSNISSSYNKGYLMTVSESEGSNISNSYNKGHPMTVSESEESNISSSYNKGHPMTVSESEGSNISNNCNKGYPMTVSESEWSNISSSYNKGYLMTVSESEGSNISSSYNKGYPMTVSESEWSNISSSYNKGYLMTVSESEGSNISNSYNKGHPMTVSESEWSNISNNFNKGYLMTVSESEGSNISSSYNKGYLMTVSESEGSNISNSYNKGHPMTVSESEESNISSSYNKGYLMTVSESEGSNISNSYNKGHPMTVSESEESNISSSYNKGYPMTVSESEGSNISSSYNKGYPMTVSGSEGSNISNNCNIGYPMIVSEREKTRIPIENGVKYESLPLEDLYPSLKGITAVDEFTEEKFNELFQLANGQY